MVPWRRLNARGRVLAVMCVINMWCAVVIAMDGKWMSLVSAFFAMICGVGTYSSRAQRDNLSERE